MTAEGIAQMATDPTMHPAQLGDGRPTASYTLRVNGFERPVTDAWIGESLLYVLRERLGLAGAKNGCEQGECGACSVQVDGQLVAGCLVPAALAADSEISTVESLSAAGSVSDVQQALADSGAVQCGYCTPGMAMAVHDLLQRNHRPTEVEARQALCGNLCRCTGYRSALAAVQTVADGRAAALLAAEEADAAKAEAAKARAQAPAPAVDGPSGGPEQGDAGEPADPPVYQDAWSGTQTAGEVPIFEAEDGWISAEEAVAPGVTAAGTGLGVIPPQGYPGGYQQHGYPPAPEAVYEPTPAHGTPTAPFEGTPAQGTPYEPTPAHGTPYPGPGFDQAQPPYPYAEPVYPGPGYDPAGGHGTPAHGVPAGPFDGPVYETAPGTPEAGTPAHGLLPEDDRA
ncbi:2Fe-2S iron-sulfur cluster-binding protein [Kitasatospora sp. NPDC006697]|uniref:2Fe-2S iron-sulfur cluster-binding protein n=1 Tax=Kitasatospora sp. NPDC006697 TaxID=3364020 RepID=UPI0036CFDC1A